MSFSLAIANLRHNPVRTALSLAGVGLAVVLIFMELGFLGAVQQTAVVIYRKLDFDLVIRSPEYLHLADARWISKHRLQEASAIEGVSAAHPFHVTLGNWQTPCEGNWLAILILAVDPASNGLLLPGLPQELERLTTDDAILFDSKSDAIFGPWETPVEDRCGRPDCPFCGAEKRPRDRSYLGLCTDLSGRKVCIRGEFDLETGLAAKGAVLLNERGFQRVAPYDPRDQVSLGLLKVARGQDPAEVRQRLVQWYAARPDEPRVEVLTRAEVERRETKHWVQDTPIGTIFMLSVGVALLVGSAIVYMVLSNDVEMNLGEYATLNAMGYSKAFLARVVLWLAALLALAAYVPSVLIAMGLYTLTESFAHVPISMDWPRIAYVLLLTLVMSVVSGLLAMRKLQRADPADLF